MIRKQLIVNVHDSLSRSLCILIAIVITSTATPQVAFAQTCACDGDMWQQDGNGCLVPPDDFISFDDVTVAIACVQGIYEPDGPYGHCPEVSAAQQQCDINCDGKVDACDTGQVVEAWLSNPNPCSVPCGACYHTRDFFPNCIVTTRSLCGGEGELVELLGENTVYQGDGTTTCVPEPVLPDPDSPGGLACGSGPNYGQPCMTCTEGGRAGELCLVPNDCRDPSTPHPCEPNDALCGEGVTCGSNVAGGNVINIPWPKNRYIGFLPPAIWIGQEIAIRVTLVVISHCDGGINAGESCFSDSDCETSRVRLLPAEIRAVMVRFAGQVNLQSSAKARTAA